MGTNTGRDCTIHHVMKEDLAKETGTTAVLAAVATRRQRAPCPRVSSRHFDTESKAASEASADQLPKALKGLKGERRSEYFTSTPDSCAGSASSFDWGSAFTEKAFFALKSCEHFEHTGVRHMCKNRCYFRAYEPVRKWHALRLAVARLGASTGVLTGWCVQMDRGQAAEDSWRIRYVAPDGSVFPCVKPVLEALGLGHGVSGYPTSPPSLRRKRRTPTTPPQPLPAACATIRHHPNGSAYLLKKPRAGTFPPSPFGLIEELLTDDPWKLLIGCIMLNQTTRSQMDPVLVRFLEKFPTADVAAAASVDEMTRVVAPLGLQERRPIAIIRFSQEYLSKAWTNVKELYWVGKYAADAHKIFIERKWREVQPDDHALNWWVEWMRGTQQAEEPLSAAERSVPALEEVWRDGSANTSSGEQLEF
ncbi:unnamed protein product [Ectocarpus sp. 12 AP-2014]